ncbi:MAG TPA: maleate cis-trans isomerase [Nocardioidaceae bacterium]|nr:maleate cis-trans isomerase [Nocardioidaceae bacterium]
MAIPSGENRAADPGADPAHPAAPAVGLLYPGYGAEDDFPALEARLAGRLRLPLVHTSVGEDAHRVDALLDLGGPERLAAGGRVLLEHRPDSVMWACTSGSFVFGWDGAHEQVGLLAEQVGLPVSSTSLAFVHALAALGATRVSVAASYPQEVAERFVEFLAKGGVEVLGMDSHGIYTAAQVGTLGRDQVLAMVRGADRPDADAILVPDTAMHSLAWVAGFEDAVGKPVLTANQVTVWEGLRICDRQTRLPDLGALFAG